MKLQNALKRIWNTMHYFLWGSADTTFISPVSVKCVEIWVLHSESQLEMHA